MHENRILYEDNDILVCHKPAGIATQTARIGQADMVSETENYLAQSSSQNVSGKKPPDKRGSISHQPQIYVVHRLDQPVEGILVFAKHPSAAAALSAQTAGEEMEKEYLALVCDLRAGETADGMQGSRQTTERVQESRQGQSGVLRDHLLKDGKTNISRIVPPEVKGAKEARLRYEILQEEIPEILFPAKRVCGGFLGKDGTEGNGLRCAVVRIRLYTGRHHQIRVQMANAGMPLLGDRKYAPKETIALSGQLGIRDAALCAYRLCFFHPETGERLHFEIRPEGAAFQGIRF